MDALTKVLGLRSMADSGRDARARSISHIQGVLRDNNVPKSQRTVGDAVIASISTIRMAAGERGAEDVDRLFRSEEMKNAYLTPLGSDGEEQAQRFVASREKEFWTQKAQQNPTQGNIDAASFTVSERIQFQRNFGALDNLTQDNLRYYQQQQTFAQYSNAPFSSNSRGESSHQSTSGHRHHSSGHHHSSKSGQGNGQGSSSRRHGPRK
ncbi:MULTISPECIES: hypothetical protein [unclassified Streptomyces]|uniref:hypothetical protein n=1 Tax=unclassified Streptomyces TaxID=2593676 RepID=UPI002DD8CCFB|nr:hypothetical protein [Streptomyces sp. NBC_01795]WSA93314.1 hypothetical protein OIE63_18305 [Streptomyces sp. NBC_01795]WSS42868.1 hypothetical protein OG220_21515 [Streptomyces sp. NBC_01187]